MSFKEQIQLRFRKRNTDLTTHLPMLYHGCLEHLKKTQGHVIVELMVNTGESTYVFDLIAKTYPVTLIGINPDPNYHTVYQEYVTHSQSFFYPLKSDEYALKHSLECQKHQVSSQIDLLWIDSSHYHDVTLDRLQQYVPMLAPQGMIVLHDTNMAPIKDPIHGHGWELTPGHIMYGGWDNQV